MEVTLLVQSAAVSLMKMQTQYLARIMLSLLGSVNILCCKLDCALAKTHTHYMYLSLLRIPGVQSITERNISTELPLQTLSSIAHTR